MSIITLVMLDLDLTRSSLLNSVNQAKPQYQVSVNTGVSAANPPSSHSKFAVSSTLKAMATTSASSNENKSNILAKLREKVAAEKTADNSVAITKQIDETKPVSISSSTYASKYIKAIHLAKTEPAVKPEALKSIVDPSNIPSKEKQLSPMQTYEMSDREEESDSEEESDEESENQKPKKAVS